MINMTKTRKGQGSFLPHFFILLRTLPLIKKILGIPNSRLCQQFHTLEAYDTENNSYD